MCFPIKCRYEEARRVPRGGALLTQSAPAYSRVPRDKIDRSPSPRVQGASASAGRCINDCMENRVPNGQWGRSYRDNRSLTTRVIDIRLAIGGVNGDNTGDPAVGWRHYYYQRIYNATQQSDRLIGVTR